MPRQKDLKRIIRARMQKTGEAYTTARSQITRKSLNDATAAETAAEDYSSLAGMSDESISAKTGRNWEQWVRELDSHGGEQLAHKDIAALVHGGYGVEGWWSQTVTVGYERIKGLRDRGQRRRHFIQYPLGLTHLTARKHRVCESVQDQQSQEGWKVFLHELLGLALRAI